MCERFSQSYTWAELHEAYSIIKPDMPQNLEFRYNIGRFQMADILRPLGHGLNRPSFAGGATL